jgi:WD40 repeat protein
LPVKEGTLGLRTLPDLKPVSGQQDLPVIQKTGTSIGKIAWSNLGDFVAVGLSWETENKTEILRFYYDGRTLTAVDARDPIQIPSLAFSFAWHPNDKQLAIGTEGGTVIVYDVATGQTESVVGHDGRVHTLSWSRDGRLLFTRGDDGSLRVWDYDPEQRNKLTLAITLRQDTGAIHAIGLDPDGDGVYTGGTNPKIFYWPKDRYSSDAILERAEKMVDRNMTRAEWMRYAEKDKDRQQHYQRTFEDLPGLFQ